MCSAKKVKPSKSEQLWKGNLQQKKKCIGRNIYKNKFAANDNKGNKYIYLLINATALKDLVEYLTVNYKKQIGISCGSEHGTFLSSYTWCQLKKINFLREEKVLINLTRY